MIDIGGKDLLMLTDDHGWTVLHFTCGHGTSLEVIRLLVRKGGKDLVMAKANDGCTSLHYLCMSIQKHSDPAGVINVLVTAGGNDLLSVKEDKGLLTALDIATNQNKKWEGIKHLLTKPQIDATTEDTQEAAIDVDVGSATNVEEVH